MRFDSQFARMNCQMFSWGLSSGARGGSGRSGLIENENGVCAGGDFRCDFVEMELHGLAVAGGQHQGGTGPKFRADRTEQIGGLGALIGNGAGT